jgi:hypothetical protein
MLQWWRVIEQTKRSRGIESKFQFTYKDKFFINKNIYEMIYNSSLSYTLLDILKCEYHAYLHNI